MSLVVLTLQDEEDGTVSLGFTSEPALADEDEHLTNAQILALMCVHQVMLALEGEDTEQTV